MGISDVTARLGCSQKTVRRLVREGALPAIRFRPRGHLRFRPQDVDRLLEPNVGRAA